MIFGIFTFLMTTYQRNYCMSARLTRNQFSFGKDCDQRCLWNCKIRQMDNYINILQKLLKVIGLDILSQQHKRWQLIIRLMLIFSNLFLISALFCSVFDPQNDFADKLLKYMYGFGSVVVLIQVYVFLKNKSKILDLSIWLKKSYTEQSLMFVQRYTKKPILQRYKCISIGLLK